MTDSEKMRLIAESMDVEVSEIDLDTVLEDIDTWDSVAILSIIAVFNEKFDKYPTAETIISYKTVKDLMDAME